MPSPPLLLGWTIFLGIRTSVRPDTHLCPAELVYGTHLRLPGEFVAQPDLPPPPLTTDFAVSLRNVLRDQRPPAASHQRPEPSGPSSLVPDSVSHVFVWIDAVRRPLTRPYDGPFQVLDKSPKTFTVLRSGKPWTVSVDRLKPALVDALGGTFPVSPSARPLLPQASFRPRTPVGTPTLSTEPESMLSAEPSSASSTVPESTGPATPCTGANATDLRSGRVSRLPERYRD